MTGRASVIACAACLMMAAVDLLHIGNALSPLLVASTILGGALMFAIVWLPARWGRRPALAQPATALLVGAAVGFGSSWLAESDTVIDVVGASGFLGAAPLFLVDRGRPVVEDLLFAAACVLLAAADLAFTYLPTHRCCVWLDRGVHLSGFLVLTALAIRIDMQRRLGARNAELEQELQARTEFVTALIHDLRNPLSAARLAAQLLDSQVGEAGHRSVGRIYRSLERLNKMIEDFLDASRISAGHPLPLEISHCDMVAIAREVIDEQATTHGDRFVLDGPTAMTGHWWQKGFRRVIENLVSNAVKYGARDMPITIAIGARDDERVALSVHNWGKPLSQQDCRLIFAPYARGQLAEESKRKGWGIGLSLVRGIVEAHGGVVTVRSAAESGTTFTVEVPRDARAQRPAPPDGTVADATSSAT